MCDNIHGALPTRETHLSLCVQSFCQASTTQAWLIAAVVDLSLQDDWYHITKPLSSIKLVVFLAVPAFTLNQIVWLLSVIQGPQANKDTPFRHDIPRV